MPDRFSQYTPHIAGVKSPEETIRSLVKGLSGYDVPALGLSLNKVTSRNPSAMMSSASGFKMPGTEGLADSFRQQEADEAAHRQRMLSSQLNLQKMEHDRVKRDLADRGLLPDR